MPCLPLLLLLLPVRLITHSVACTLPSPYLSHTHTQPLQPGRVYNLRQAKADIDSIYSTGLFEDVNITPQEAEDSTESHPKVCGGVLPVCV